jgi:hypothetical protein
LAPVEHPFAYAAVSFDVCQGLGPTSLGGEGARAVGEEYAPQPRADLMAVLVGLGEVRRYRDAFEPSSCARLDGLVQVEQSLTALVRVAGADLEAGEVDDRFQPPDRAHAGQGAGVEVGGGVLVAHLACEVGESEVGGDERGLVVDGRCEPWSVFFIAVSARSTSARTR